MKEILNQANRNIDTIMFKYVTGILTVEVAAGGFSLAS